MRAASIVAWGWVALLIAAPVSKAQEQPPQATSGTECFPPCRPGYLCHEGACVEACNPPCGPGERCSAEGDCVPAPAPPSAPPTVSDPSVDYSAPPPPPPSPTYGPGEWQAPGAARPPKPRAPGDGFRLAASFFLAAGGEMRSFDPYRGDFFESYSMGLTPGFAALIEGNFPYFGLGGGFRVLWWSFDELDESIRGIDLILLSPRVRIPFEGGEVYFATPVGMTFDSLDLGTGRWRGIGFNFAAHAGVQIEMSATSAFFVQAGGLFRSTNLFAEHFDGPFMRTRQFLIEAGFAWLP
jgi:hypothetical protein